MIHLNEQIQYLYNKKTKGISLQNEMPLVSPISYTLLNHLHIIQIFPISQLGFNERYLFLKMVAVSEMMFGSDS
ncbi:hypothetical protein bcgnr5388_02400 [Bacillus cereus]